MKKNAILVSVIVATVALSAPVSFAKSKGKRSSSSQPAKTSSPASTKQSTPEKKTDTAKTNRGGLGATMAAGIGGAIIGSLAGNAIASAFASDDASTLTESPLTKMTPEESIQSAKDMQTEAAETGFSYNKGDILLRKADKFIKEGSNESKQRAHEIAILVHAWAQSGMKQSEALKSISSQLGL